jgi:hypothetical protein
VAAATAALIVVKSAPPESSTVQVFDAAETFVTGITGTIVAASKKRQMVITNMFDFIELTS